MVYYKKNQTQKSSNVGNEKQKRYKTYRKQIAKDRDLQNG